MSRTHPGGAVVPVETLNRVMREALPDVTIADTEGNSLVDHFGPILPPEPSPIVAARAAVGLPTRPPGTPNGWRMVVIEPGGPVLFVPPGSEP